MKGGAGVGERTKKPFGRMTHGNRILGLNLQNNEGGGRRDK